MDSIKCNIINFQIENFLDNSRSKVLPIKNTLQPSGQSVSLQSLACRTPLVTNNYEGLWEKKALKHLRNCYLLEQNANVDDWVKTIKFIFEENKKFNQLTNNGYKELIEKYHIMKIIFLSG